jgi:DNA polymerase-3 subunit gamma/tau
MESRHIDVLEMDAASHTGIDDVKQLTDGVRYSPASARYKVYIIDEVHMLSDKAFNAFLKTLEEPPPHAKFIFATTEIRKVPITILSRCQRFDLRRVEADVLVPHLKGICEKEHVQIDAEALALIARAAEGSVRDALSLLDQAISHGAGSVDGETVRAMLGLADRARVIDLFEAVMSGRIADALGNFKEQYALGADPQIIMNDLADFTHFVTRLKVMPSAADDSSVTEVERVRGLACAAMPMRALSRAWQILLKGSTEIAEAAKPAAAAEMVLVRLAYAADLPTPDEALRALTQNGETVRAPQNSGSSAGSSSGGPTASGNLSVAYRAEPERMPVVAPMASVAVQEAPVLRLDTFEQLIALATEQRDIAIKTALERDVRLVAFENGRLEFAPMPGASPGLAADLTKRISDWTGRRWIVAVSSQEGQTPVREVAKAKQAEQIEDVRENPIVKSVLATFPGAEIIEVRDLRQAVPVSDEDADLPDLPPDFDFGGLDHDRDD